MDDTLRQQKIEMWTKKRAQVEEELKDALLRKGEAAREGDLRENAAYKQAIEDSEMANARLADIDKILSDLGVGPGDKNGSNDKN